MANALKRPWPFENGHQPRLPPQPGCQGSGEDDETCNLEVCFGSITDARAQLLPKARHISSYRWDRTAQSFDIVQEGDFFTLRHETVGFARLNKGLCKAFLSLTTERPVRLVAEVLLEDWTEALRSWDTSDTRLLPAEVHLYGAVEYAPYVGKILSLHALLLQYPLRLPSSIRYYNPHLLHIEGCDGLIFPERILEVATNATELRNRDGLGQTEADEPAEIEEILDALSHRVTGQEIFIDRAMVKSALLPHQKEAINFILQRETGQISSDLTLWRYNDVDADEPFYQHAFTGAKKPHEQEAPSGIIADEMGLGKSLVMLSLIAGSLHRAAAFVTAEKELQLSNTQRKAATRATLIVAPSSLLIDSWIDEIRKHILPGALSLHKHLGPGRHKELNLLHERLIVFTTYATLAKEYCSSENSLAKVRWFRVVLDEAHDIRNPSTKQFEAAAALSAQHRWCLTGTPIQNTLEDLGALVSFLKVPILENPATFRKFIINPISNKSGGRFQNLRTLFQTICIRRTRELLHLPEPIPQTRRLAFQPLEQADYDDLLVQCRLQLDMAVSGRRKAKINSTILHSLLKLRLFCNNGIQADPMKLDDKGLPPDPDEALSYLQQRDQNSCVYCSGIIYSIDDGADSDGGKFLSCRHLMCHNCIPHHRKQKGRCPACAAGPEELDPAVLTVGGFEGLWSNQGEREPQFPSKLAALLSDLQKDPRRKSIVFSSWKKTLLIAGQLLSSHNLKFEMIDGSLPLSKRVKVLNAFRSPLGANVLLMTLGTGAVGLNLAVASRIFLLEPQWNPSVESQAIGRALRLGQTEQVVIIRYVMKSTIEESNVLSRQKKKLQLMGGGFGKGSDSDDKLRALESYLVEASDSVRRERNDVAEDIDMAWDN